MTFFKARSVIAGEMPESYECLNNGQMLKKRNPYAILVLIALSAILADAAWTDKTAGVAALRHYTPRDLGFEHPHTWFVKQDALGRLFVGGPALSIFNGESWVSQTIGGQTILRTIEIDPAGKLWIGAFNEIGYLLEKKLGQFEYHSLIAKLPEHESQVGQIWGSALIGDKVFFTGREKIYGWDGSRFHVWKFPGQSRLFPLKLGRETWVHHRETGLYRLTESGPDLAFSSQQLPNCAIFGLKRDDAGLLLIGESGQFRAGELNSSDFPQGTVEFMVAGRVTSFAELPGGRCVIGTVNDGLAILDPNGKIVRHINAKDHPAAVRIMSITLSSDGALWCATGDGILQIEPTGSVSLHGVRTGLNGGASGIAFIKGTLIATNDSGTYRLEEGEKSTARFVRIPYLKEAYTSLSPTNQGLMLGRLGGIDIWNGDEPTTIYRTQSRSVHRIQPSRLNKDTYLLSEGDGLVELRRRQDSQYTFRRFGSIPDFSYWIAEDSFGTIWVSTASQGVFTVDANSGIISRAKDSSSGQSVDGYVCFSEHPGRLLVYATGRIYSADSQRKTLTILRQLPEVATRFATAVPGKTEALVIFKKLNPSIWNPGASALARLNLTDASDPLWEVIDVPALGKIGIAHSAVFSEESGRRILWIGGTEGLLRLDYDTLPLMTPPPAPVIRLDEFNSSEVRTPAKADFKFENHRVAFRVYTGDPSRAEDWLVQVRLSQNAGDWSAPSRRRGYEYSNLSHGLYQFEARTINAAGMASAPVNFSFRVLPPWYQSGPAYVGYSLALAASLAVTVRVRERRMRSQQAALEQLVRDRTEDLLKANAAKDEFLAAISHEIRNPLNGVVGIAHSLPHTGLAPEDHRKFGLLRTCAEHLSSLLENLLDLSKIQAGMTEIDSKPFELHALIDSVVAMSAFDSEHRRIPVQTMVHPDAPRYLMGDARRVRQILLNFVGNALKYSDAGAVLIEVQSRPGAGAGVIDVTFSVTDEGPGVPEAHQERLFGRFERRVGSCDGKREGTGLGLAICRGFADKMGGKVWLKSAPGRGSSFYFSAPFSTADVPSEALDPRLLMQDTGRRALIVDDQEHNRIVLADLLEKLGIDSTSTSSGIEAVSLAAANRFDYVLIDYDLPDITGLQVAHQIRAQANGSCHAHLVAVTAYCTPEQKRECLEAGMDSFIGKPVSPDRLRKIIFRRPGDGSDLSPTGEIASAPDDPLVNLRLLAARKCIKLEVELDLFIRELRAELAELKQAIDAREPVATSKYAHRLKGQLGFIFQRNLADLCCRINEAATKRDWPCVDLYWRELGKGGEELEASLGSSAPNVRLG